MTHKYEILLALGVISPMISFWLLVFFGPKLGKPKSGWLCVALGMGVPLLCATWVLVGWWLGEDPASRAALTENAYRFHWANLGTIPIDVGVKLDSLTVAMYFMVTLIALLIFIFSVGYMAGHSDEVAGTSKYHRFFAYLSLFGFSMLGLVVSSSLLFLFIFWELVGLCSYLLIGYYFDKAFASAAAMKAFITNRVGDFGFIIGMMLVVFHLGTFDLDQAAENFAAQYAAGTGLFASTYTLLGWSLPTLMGMALFCGAMAKSAQFPLHVWLPDAMAGPTPVSALIHAATMVAAGVYLVARVFRLMTPEALLFVAGIGCITLTLMALVAVVQTDIKKCLAYSTLSQLGYMIFGLGCGAWVAALFHLMTHAFFKAMLFLASGQVIEGCHHEQDMRKMGGLIRKMPFTGWTFLVGVLAISGTGIPGLGIGIGGYHSKDEILAVAYVRAYEWESYDDLVDEGHGGEHARADRSGDPNPIANTRTPIRLASMSLGTAPQADDGEKTAHPKKAGTFLPAFTHGDAQHELQQAGGDRDDDRPGLARSGSETHAAGTAHSDDGAHAGDGHGAAGTAAIFARMANVKIPKWMFWAAIITAYITPFYMFRCWWMTFMGQPRDEHVYEHAHESKLMYLPLVALAIGTLWASYYLFRPLIADAAGAATAASMVMAIDGTSHAPAIHHAHQALFWTVGFAFLIGIGFAFFIYRNGLDTAERIRRIAPISVIHTVLVRKYYIDELYGFVWVKGCVLVAKICRFFDTWVVDMFYDTLAAVTERFAAFLGMVFDAQFVDGLFNGVAQSSMDLAGVAQRPQTGRIRNYVLFAVGVAAVAVICLVYFGTSGQPASAVAMGGG